MAPSATHVLLLAGGTGSRMSPLVSPTLPKCLLTLANRPMLFYSLFSLTLSSFPHVTIAVESQHLDQIRTYCLTHFPNDPLIQQASLPSPTITFVPRHEDQGTADIIRQLDLVHNDLLVLSSDYVGDIDLTSILKQHRQTKAAATVTFLSSAPDQSDKPTETSTSTKPKSKKQPKKKPSKPDNTTFAIDNYALLTPSDTRLLGLYSKADISDGTLRVRPALIQRYPSIVLRSDLFDPHIYVFNVPLLRRLLQTNHNISSVKFDLVPYLARRQHTLATIASEWDLPLSDVSVFATILKRPAFAKRANTVPTFHALNMEIAAGNLHSYLNRTDDAENEPQNSSGATKKKAKKQVAKPQSPFETEGERVNVSPDSLVGPGCTAGDRASVKKSVVGADCCVASNVKINGCVILPNVTLEEGVNLAGCIVCEGAVVGKGSTLKDCRIAAEVTVEHDTEAQDRDFTPSNPDEDTDLGQAFEFF